MGAKQRQLQRLPKEARKAAVKAGRKQSPDEEQEVEVAKPKRQAALNNAAVKARSMRAEAEKVASVVAAPPQTAAKKGKAKAVTVEEEAEANDEEPDTDEEDDEHNCTEGQPDITFDIDEEEESSEGDGKCSATEGKELNESENQRYRHRTAMQNLGHAPSLLHPHPQRRSK